MTEQEPDTGDDVTSDEDNDELGDFEDEVGFLDDEEGDTSSEDDTRSDEDEKVEVADLDDANDATPDGDVPHSFEDVDEVERTSDIETGDVVLDLTQGRTMQVVEEHRQTAREWSGENDYELVENYANERMGASEDDLVYECVYAGSVKNRPSKSYAFPESRLARVEVEEAVDGRRVQERIARDVLVGVFDSMLRYDALDDEDVEAVARHIGGVDEDVVDEAHELARVEQEDV